MRTVKLGMEESFGGIVNLYDKVAEVLGYEDTTNLNYDCTKIDVATNIMENIEAFYKERVDGDYVLAFGMDWVCYGPKQNKDLADDEVMIEDGFIKEVV